MTDRPLSPRAERLRQAGYHLTNARLTVLKVLEDSDAHLTSTQVLEQVNALDDSIGRASIFRTLDLFTRLSIIRPTYIDSTATPAYVLMAEGHHHHIICTHCHRVIEFEDCCLGDLAALLEQQHGVQITGHMLELYGLCAACQE